MFLHGIITLTALIFWGVSSDSIAVQTSQSIAQKQREGNKESEDNNRIASPKGHAYRTASATEHVKELEKILQDLEKRLAQERANPENVRRQEQAREKAQKELLPLLQKINAEQKELQEPLSQTSENAPLATNTLTEAQEKARDILTQIEKAERHTSLIAESPPKSVVMESIHTAMQAQQKMQETQNLSEAKQQQEAATKASASALTAASAALKGENNVQKPEPSNLGAEKSKLEQQNSESSKSEQQKLEQAGKQGKPEDKSENKASTENKESKENRKAETESKDTSDSSDNKDTSDSNDSSADKNDKDNLESKNKQDKQSKQDKQDKLDKSENKLGKPEKNISEKNISEKNTSRKDGSGKDTEQNLGQNSQQKIGSKAGKETKKGSLQSEYDKG